MTHQPEYIIIGRIARPHGVRGEVRVEALTAEPGRFARLEWVFLGRREGEVPARYSVEGVRFHQNFILMKLAGVDDRTAAGRLRAQLVQVPFSEAIPLAEGEFFIFELLGMTAVTDEGETLGRVADVIQTGANDVLVVRGGPRGEVLLPDTDEVVLDVSREERRITVHLLPGLLSD